MDYYLKIKNLDVCRKTAEMIRFRAEHPEFRLSTRKEIKEQFEVLPSDKNVIAYQIGDLLVFHALSAVKIDLDGTYRIVFSNVRNEYETVTGSFNTMSNESVVLEKVK